MKGVDEVEKQQENEKQIKEYLTANGLIPSKDTLGMYAMMESFNPGARKLTLGDSVSVNYEIFRLDGTKVTGSESGKPLVFLHGYAPIYAMDFVATWMRVGEKVTVLAPYYLAFGSGGSSDGKVPAYSPIRLVMEIVHTKSENDQIVEYIAKNKLTVDYTTPENIRIVRLNQVTGDTLGMGKQITVAYKGYLLSGKKFDEGAFNHLTGSNQVIKGFDKGLRNMRPGEKAWIIFPSAQGYGAYGTEDRRIPAFAPLAFEVEITKAN
ncbi:FKBP-type peptidyl-prolyl cis-trans isomerase N-terminal domain-containing protein [Ravibacter arvi]|uniref:Peptidyl-prolyl cis-trans isomerase n=2 Tax=Ravibacter arvi TaxID=2051041 RepID=A0ABP8M1Y1_9BACT